MEYIALLTVIGVVVNSQEPSVPCGVSVVQPVTKRTVGGKEAAPGSWPWAVMLIDDQGFVVGTGTILHPSVILTSAQHFKGDTFNLSDINIGAWKLYTGRHNVHTADPDERYYTIRRVIVHEAYNVVSLLNDVALIITENPIQYNNKTRPVCLPDNGNVYSIGETCYLPGWGSSSSAGNDEVLNQVDLPILDDSVCHSHFSDFLPNTELCAGYDKGGKLFCTKDVGSPLVCEDSSRHVWYIQGIASSGDYCSNPDNPGVFEDVSKYRQWILHQMASAVYRYQY